MCSGGKHGLPDLVICLTAKSLTSIEISRVNMPLSIEEASTQ